MQNPSRHAHIDLKKAVLNPESMFDAPEDVLAEPTLTDAEKVEVLRVWAYDATECGVALEEGMPGGENGLLQRILLVLEKLSAHVDMSLTTSTKQHGIPKSAVSRSDTSEPTATKNR